MKTVDLDRVQFVTHYFNELQGLRLMVPSGLLFLSLAVLAGFKTLPAQLLPVAVLVSMVLMRSRLRSYYRTRFGEVESPERFLDPVQSLSPAGSTGAVAIPRGRFWTFAGLAFFPFAVLWFLSPLVAIDTPTDWSRLASQTLLFSGAPSLKLDPTGLLLVMYFFSGSLLLGTWLRRGRRLSQGYNLGLGLLLLGLATVGASLGYVLQALFDRGIPRIAQAFVPALVSPSIALALCGGAFVLAGLLDHWQLVRALGSPVEEGQP